MCVRTNLTLTESGPSSDPDNVDEEMPCALSFNFSGGDFLLLIKNRCQKISSVQSGIASYTFYISLWCNFVKFWHQLRKFAIHERCFHAMLETMSMTQSKESPDSAKNEKTSHCKFQNQPLF